VDHVAMKALIIEDDPAACALLRHHLSRMTQIEIVGEAGTVAAAAVALARNDHDLVFLDIELPDGSGLDVVRLIRPPAHVIFVTGHDRYAARAFELNALDYIVKPVTAARLEVALNRAASTTDASAATPRRFSLSDKIFLKGALAGGRFASVQDIVAILSSQNYSEVLLADGERWFVRRTMQAWQQILPAGAFLSVHRTTIVNLAFVDRIERTADERSAVTLRGVRQPFPVSRRLWPALRTWIDATAGAECKLLDRHTGSAVRHRELAADS